MFLWLCASRRCFPIAVFVFLNALKKLSASIANKIRITQITFEFIENALLVYQRWFGLCFFDVVGNFLLVKTGRRSLFIFFPRSDSCLRTTSADLWSLNGRIIQTGAFAWTSQTCCWFRDSMNLVIVELIRFSGYFSFKKIPFKLSHSSANRSGEDERQWARFNIVTRRDRL